jgi:hypothetical protein
MKQFLRLFLLFALVLTTGVFANAQDKTVTAPKAATAQEKLTAKDYQTLLDKVKSGDLSIDFRKLRFAFTETDNNSSSVADKEQRGKMFKALTDKKHKEVLKMAEKALEANYVDLNAHYIAFVANKELKNAEKAEFHRNVLNKLIDSILRGNDGKTAEKSFEVIVVDEEYSLLRLMGYRVIGQSLQKVDGHAYDVISVEKSDSKEATKFYFNVDKVFEAYNKLVGD